MPGWSTNGDGTAAGSVHPHLAPYLGRMVERTAAARSLRRALARRLADAGFVASLQEADELIEAAAGDDDRLQRLVARRLDGEPLAWLTGSVTFAGHRVRVNPGVYVPRPQTEPLVERAIGLLPDDGLAADLCTGSGAIAVALGRARPKARVVATDIDPAACRCAAENGVEVFAGHLAEPLPSELRGHFHVVIAVAPYVPTDEMVFLPRDVREHEPLLALDGGPDGTGVLVPAVWAGAGLLCPGGTLLLELGGDEDRALVSVLEAAGFEAPRRHEDADGDLRGVEARRPRWDRTPRTGR
jgi:release factor glutamine methyltransferase